MDNVSRPMILRIGTATLDKDMKRIKKLLISAGYQEVEEGKYAHSNEPMLSAVLNMGEITDTATGEVLQEIIELILSDADSHVNQTIYNALATVFPLELSK